MKCALDHLVMKTAQHKLLISYYITLYRKSSIKPSGGLFISSMLKGDLIEVGGGGGGLIERGAY